MTQGCSLPSGRCGTPSSRRRCRSTFPVPKKPGPRRPHCSSSSTTTSSRAWRPSTRPCSRWSVGRPVPASPRWSTPWSGRTSRAAGCCGPRPDRPCWSTIPRTPAGSPDPASCRASPAGTGAAPSSAAADDPSAVRLVPSPALPPGWPLLDAPDIDSVVQANRDLATQLLVRRRPVAVRHHGSPLRRRRAMGAAARGGASGARPWRSCWTACRPRPWRRSAPTSPRCCASRALPTRRCSRCPSRARRDGQLPEGDVARLRSWLAALARDAQGARDRHTAHPHAAPWTP